MRRKSKSKEDEEWLKEFGRHIEELILSKGYNSVYDFWKETASEHVSRATLNYIVAGQIDARISTIRKIYNLMDENFEIFTS